MNSFADRLGYERAGLGNRVIAEFELLSEGPRCVKNYL